MARQWTLFALILSLASCREWKQVEKHVDPDENQAILAKLDGYVSCLRDHSKQVFQIADFYIAPLGGNPPTAHSELRLSATPDPEKCLKAITAARELAPATPALVRAGDEFAQALEAVHSLTSAGAKYLARDNPETFAIERGLALHPELIAAFSAFEAAQGRLFDEVFQLNRKVHQVQLTGPAPTGKGAPTELELLWNRMFFEAEGVASFAAQPQRLRSELEAFAQQLQAFERAYAAASAHISSTKQMEDYRGALAVAQDLITDGRQLEQRTRTNLPYTDAERIMIASNNEKAVVGSPMAVIETYNLMMGWQ